MTKLKILGSVSPFCSKTSNCPGYMIYDDKNKILLDCGNGISKELTFPDDLENLNIFISHMHKDHYSDLFSIGYASYVYRKLGLLKNKVKVYIPKKDKKSICDYNIIMNFTESYFDVLFYDENSNIIIGNKILNFQKGLHNINAYVTRIIFDGYKITYSGDTGYYKELESFIDNSDIFICETTFLTGEKNNNIYHMDTTDVAFLALNSNIKKLIITHFWPDQDKNKYLEEIKNKFENVEIAVEGKIYNCLNKNDL